MSENRGKQKKLLVDSSLEEVCNELFFIPQEDIAFWMNNEDFRNEYRRLYYEGEDDGFYLFLETAQLIMTDIEHNESLDPDSYSGFDFKTAYRSIRVMKKSFKQGFDNRALNKKLLFLLNRISVPRDTMKRILMIPEFSSKIEQLIPTGITINDRAVYEVLKRVLNENSISIANREMGSRRLHELKYAINCVEKRLKIPEIQRFKYISTNGNQNSTSDEDSDSE